MSKMPRQKNKVQQISRERVSENVDFLRFILGRSTPEEIALWRISRRGNSL